MERTITADAVPQAKTRTMTNFRWKIAFLIFLISFVAYMDRVNLSVATPVIMQEFGFDKMDMGFLQTCFFAGYALMQVPGGMLAERFGLRKTGAGAILWWSVFTALTAFAQGKASFAAVRLAFGLGEGPVFPSLGQATFNWFNKDEKGKASSAILLGTFFGPVIGPMVTVALIAALGWHAVFIIFGLYIAAHTASGAAATIFWMSVSLGALGFSMSASWSTVISLGGKYTGSVSGWMNLWGNVGGVLAPIVTAFFVTNYGWNNAFTYTALFGIIAIAAWLFVNPGKQLEGTEE